MPVEEIIRYISNDVVKTKDLRAIVFTYGSIMNYIDLRSTTLSFSFKEEPEKIYIIPHDLKMKAGEMMNEDKLLKKYVNPKNGILISN